jgi:hypothetical protein
MPPQPPKAMPEMESPTAEFCRAAAPRRKPRPVNGAARIRRIRRPRPAHNAAHIPLCRIHHRRPESPGARLPDRAASCARAPLSPVAPGRPPRCPDVQAGGNRDHARRSAEHVGGRTETDARRHGYPDRTETDARRQAYPDRTETDARPQAAQTGPRRMHDGRQPRQDQDGCAKAGNPDRTKTDARRQADPDGTRTDA